MLLNTSSKSYSGDRLAISLSQPRLAKMGVSYRPMNTRSNWPLPVDTSVVTRWRKTFSSTTTQFNLMSGFAASNLGESFLSSIIAGLLTVAMVTVFCSAMALAPVNRTVTKIARCLFIVLGGYRLVYLSWRLAGPTTLCSWCGLVRGAIHLGTEFNR